MSVELDIFYNRLLANLKNKQAERSYKERTIFDSNGKRMRRKLEKGYLKGLDDGINLVKKTYKKFLKELSVEDRDEKG